jgi:RNA polymerase sigma factor (sigma-70 family)
MAAYVSGDQVAFRELFRRYAPALLRFVSHHVRRRADAHDLVQQTFLQLHRSRYDFRPGATLRPWLFTIAINLRLQHFRTRGRRREIAFDEDAVESAAVVSTISPQEAWDRSRELQAALAKLPSDQRDVIVLHWWQGLSFAEVSLAVGASVNAVKVRAHRGYVGLRRFLKRPGSRADRQRGVAAQGRDIEMP